MPDEEKKTGSKIEERVKSVNIWASTLAVIVGLGTTLWFTLPKQWHDSAKERTFGPCELKPQSPASISRLNGYITAGEGYARKGSYDLAKQRFQEVLDQDANFLGANQNLGVVQLAQGDLKSAQLSFEKEIHLIDCLKSVGKKDLPRFAELLKTGTPGGDIADTYTKRLDEAEDSAHYNLACVFARKAETRPAALDELKKAAEHHSIRREMVAKDPDLNLVHRESDYKTVLAMFTVSESPER